jgi:Sec-independent protein translocase protein TatA
LSIVEILVLLIVALIVIPPERLPEVMQAAGKILRELRLASNTIVRELSGAIEEPPYMSERPHDNPMTTPWSKDVSDGSANHEPPSAEPPPQA